MAWDSSKIFINQRDFFLFLASVIFVLRKFNLGAALHKYAKCESTEFNKNEKSYCQYFYKILLKRTKGLKKDSPPLNKKRNDKFKTAF